MNETNLIKQHLLAALSPSLTLLYMGFVPNRMIVESVTSFYWLQPYT